MEHTGIIAPHAPMACIIKALGQLKVLESTGFLGGGLFFKLLAFWGFTFKDLASQYTQEIKSPPLKTSVCFLQMNSLGGGESNLKLHSQVNSLYLIVFPSHLLSLCKSSKLFLSFFLFLK